MELHYNNPYLHYGANADRAELKIPNQCLLCIPDVMYNTMAMAESWDMMMRNNALNLNHYESVMIENVMILNSSYYRFDSH